VQNGTIQYNKQSCTCSFLFSITRVLGSVCHMLCYRVQFPVCYRTVWKSMTGHSRQQWVPGCRTKRGKTARSKAHKQGTTGSQQVAERRQQPVACDTVIHMSTKHMYDGAVWCRVQTLVDQCAEFEQNMLMHWWPVVTASPDVVVHMLPGDDSRCSIQHQLKQILYSTLLQ